MSDVVLSPEFVGLMPDFEEIVDGGLWVSCRYRTVQLRCPCGCGDLVVLSLGADKWSLVFDGRVSLLGSVQIADRCRSHFSIQENVVVWH